MFFLHQFTSFFEDVLECIGPGWKCEANLFFFLFLMIVALYPFGLWSLYGYGSIPIDTFLVGWTSIYQLFWGSLGTRVLTHPHMMISLWFLPATKTADRDEPPSATAPRCRCANLRLVAQIAWQAHQLWQFVIWMTVWAPRMLKWDWNGDGSKPITPCYICYTIFGDFTSYFGVKTGGFHGFWPLRHHEGAAGHEWGPVRHGLRWWGPIAKILW